MTVLDTVNDLVVNETWQVVRERVHMAGVYSISPVYYEEVSFLRENGQPVLGELIP